MKIDSENGYHYYSAEQVYQLNAIMEFKTMGFSLDEIKTVVDGEMTKEQLLKVVDLQRGLKPSIVKIFAAFNYKHIENEKSWELISRVSRDPVKAITDGVDAFIQFTQIIVSIASVFVLILSQVWWAALIIFSFSVPMFWLSMRAGKKNYQAERDAEKFNRRTEYLGEVRYVHGYRQCGIWYDSETWFSDVTFS